MGNEFGLHKLAIAVGILVLQPAGDRTRTNRTGFFAPALERSPVYPMMVGVPVTTIA